MELQYPLPTPEALKAYYETSYAEGMYHEFAAATAMKEMTAQRRLLEISRHLPIAGRWLDVGCGDGMFVRVAGERGTQASGVELSDVAVRLAKEKSLDVSCGTVECLESNKRFNTVTAFDVLEHVLDPSEFLSQLHERVEPEGSLVLTLPDMDSLARRLMGSRWYFYIPEEHLHYFNRNNLSQLLVQHGFHVKAMPRTYKPLTFDYSMIQFQQFNPWIHRVLGTCGKVIPPGLRQKIVPLPIGEMMIIAERPAA